MPEIHTYEAEGYPENPTFIAKSLTYENSKEKYWGLDGKFVDFDIVTYHMFVKRRVLPSVIAYITPSIFINAAGRTKFIPLKIQIVADEETPKA